MASLYDGMSGDIAWQESARISVIGEEWLVRVPWC